MSNNHFIIIGSPKCGTSSLYKYLSLHPQIHLHKIKEQNFFKPSLFDWTNKHRIRTKFREIVFEIFRFAFLKKMILFRYHKTIERRDGFVSGDGSCTYFSTPGVERIIHSYCPNAKLILMLRHPVDRLYSNYWMNTKTGAINFTSFEEYIEKGGWKLPENRYSENLQRWIRFFKINELLIINSDEFFLDVQKHYDSVCDFINVSMYTLQDTNPITPSSKHPRDYPVMNYETRIKLTKLLAYEQKRLYEIIGRDFNWFKLNENHSH